jgi:hypothetical protein
LLLPNVDTNTIQTDFYAKGLAPFGVTLGAFVDTAAFESHADSPIPFSDVSVATSAGTPQAKQKAPVSTKAHDAPAEVSSLWSQPQRVNLLASIGVSIR